MTEESGAGGLRSMFLYLKGIYLMPKLYLWAVLAAVMLSSLTLARADELSPAKRIDPEDLKQIMLVKDVKTGMKGYGKTVFQGTKIETFNVEVLGILKKANMGTDLILVKMSGGPMTGRGANIIRGMSGSPIYIGGKLVGAFAYGQAFMKEPIGMVTPIEYMLEAWDSALPQTPSSFSPYGTAMLEKPIPLDGKTFSRVRIEPGDPESASAEDGTLVLHPLSMPLAVSGMSPHIAAKLARNLKPLGITPVSGSGPARDKSNLNIKLEPGSAVAVSLVTGDIDMTGTGTVTYRRGNRILAFGHPMIDGGTVEGVTGMGPLDAPISTAYVFGVSPSVYVSSKDAGPVNVVGRLLHDRPWGISGEVGGEANMIPVTVHVSDKSSGRYRDFNVRVVNHPLLAPSLIVGSAAQAIYNMRGTPSDATAAVKVQVTANEVGTITRENTWFDAMNIESAAVKDLQQILSMLQFNKFHPAGIKRVEVWADIIPNHGTARIEHIFIPEAKYRPGSRVDVGVVIRPFGQEPVTRRLLVDLPSNMPGGKYSLQVRAGTAQGAFQDGSAAARLQAMLGMAQPAPVAENLRQLLDRYLERDKNSDLVARIVLPGTVPNVAGEKFSGIPPAIAEAMRSLKSTEPGTARDEIKTLVSTEWVLSGSQTLAITVEPLDLTEKKTVKAAPAQPRQEKQGGQSGSAADPKAPGGKMSIPFEHEEPKGLAAGVPAIPVNMPAPAQAAPAAAPAVPAKPAAPKPAAPSSTQDKPVGRAPVTWKQSSMQEFSNGLFEGTAASTGNLVRLAPDLKNLCDLEELFVWSMVPDGKGGLYAGTGNRGGIYHVAADGTASIFFQVTEPVVQCLAMDKSGVLYAGTSPDGNIYRIEPSGRGRVIFSAQEKYITALAVDSRGNLYAATGEACRVYKISPGGVQLVLSSNERCALSLAADKDDNIFVGTGTNGLIYKIAADGSVASFYNVAEDSVTALAADSSGAVYAGSAPKGVIYRIEPNGVAKVIYNKSPRPIMSMQAGGDGLIWAATSESILCVDKDDKILALHNEHDLQFLSVAFGGGRVFAGTGNIGSVYLADLNAATSGTYYSPVHDCGLVSTWGRAFWTADTPDGTRVQISTRMGNSFQPDATWTAWSDPLTASGANISGEEARYIQYKAALKSAKPGVTPMLKDVSLGYLPKNRTPAVTLSSPLGGEYWSAVKTIKWTASDPDKDTLTYKIQYSADGGKTWNYLGGKISEGAAEVKPVVAKVSLDSPSSYSRKELADLVSALAKMPQITEDSKKAIMTQAVKMIHDDMTQASGRNQPIPSQRVSYAQAPFATRQTSFSWDTSRFADGTYLIKVTASDIASNPQNALTDEAVSEPFLVVNRPPVILHARDMMQVLPDGRARLSGIVMQDTICVAAVQFRVDGGDWWSASSGDGIFDSWIESFSINTEPLGRGRHTIEIKAFSESGVTSSLMVEVDV
jgi:hypothetical protein